MPAEKTNIIDEWYKVEYSYGDSGSNAIIYKAVKEINSIKGAKDFAALIIYLAETEYLEYDDKQRRMSNKLVGIDKDVRSLDHIYKYIKIELPITGKRLWKN